MSRKHAAWTIKLHLVTDTPPMETVKESSTRVLNQKTSQTTAQLVTTGGSGGISLVRDMNGYLMLQGMLKHKTKTKR